MANEPLPERYKKILDFDYREYKIQNMSKHPQMPNAKRAAQFSAFKALAGMDHIYTDTERESVARISKWENRKY